MIAATLFMSAVAVVVCGWALAVVALNVAIIVELFKTLGSRSWRLACGLVLISVVAGALWSDFQNRLVAQMFGIFILNLVPVIKFSVCWHRNTMPKNRYYATALKMTSLPSCLLVVFAGLMLSAAIISPRSFNKAFPGAHATIP